VVEVVKTDMKMILLVVEVIITDMKIYNIEAISYSEDIAEGQQFGQLFV
jgi:hypothetical protein